MILASVPANGTIFNGHVSFQISRLMIATMTFSSLMRTLRPCRPSSKVCVATILRPVAIDQNTMLWRRPGDLALMAPLSRQFRHSLDQQNRALFSTPSGRSAKPRPLVLSMDAILGRRYYQSGKPPNKSVILSAMSSTKAMALCTSRRLRFFTG